MKKSYQKGRKSFSNAADHFAFKGPSLSSTGGFSAPGDRTRSKRRKFSSPTKAK